MNKRLNYLRKFHFIYFIFKVRILVFHTQFRCSQMKVMNSFGKIKFKKLPTGLNQLKPLNHRGMINYSSIVLLLMAGSFCIDKVNSTPAVQVINSLALGWWGINFKIVLSKSIFLIKFKSTSCEIALRWMPENTFDQSILVQVMVWCHQADLAFVFEEKNQKVV